MISRTQQIHIKITKIAVCNSVDLNSSNEHTIQWLQHNWTRSDPLPPINRKSINQSFSRTWWWPPSVSKPATGKPLLVLVVDNRNPILHAVELSPRPYCCPLTANTLPGLEIDHQSINQANTINNTATNTTAGSDFIIINWLHGVDSRKRFATKKQVMHGQRHRQLRFASVSVQFWQLDVRRPTRLLTSRTSTCLWQKVCGFLATTPVTTRAGSTWHRSWPAPTAGGSSVDT